MNAMISCQLLVYFSLKTLVPHLTKHQVAGLKFPLPPRTPPKVQAHDTFRPHSLNLQAPGNPRKKAPSIVSDYAPYAVATLPGRTPSTLPPWRQTPRQPSPAFSKAPPSPTTPMFSKPPTASSRPRRTTQMPYIPE